MASLIESFTRGFKERYGYPPSEHYVRTVESAQEAAKFSELFTGAALDDLATFYSRVSAVSLPDVDTGIFVATAEDVAEGRGGNYPTRLASSSLRDILVFGSDGGGAFFAIDERSGQIVRLSGGAFVGSVYEVDESGVEIVGESFADFLSFCVSKLEDQA